MSIVILDTGCANLASMRLAIEKLGYYPIITDNPKIISSAKKMFLPGVGSASSIMNRLIKKKLVSLIKNLTFPILGICLGMQIFSSFSEESRGINMLNIIDEPVVLLDTNNLPLPHTGWNQVFYYVRNPLFHGIKEGSWFYFIHSYAFKINKYSSSQTYYGAYFTSVIQKNNFFGVQFHPEKSGKVGSRLLLNFLEM
ncbi:imidazole glycerol phosphate synthase subunit HisH [Buchnera aphidicola]|uniref:imidazole glycerol phosphate synthase subunit HisH n=1 Tax=Buchnera aphidicola TaxID=9 RepID=UPI003463E40B